MIVSRLPSDGMDWNTKGESGHRLKMILRPRETFKADVLIHLHCPDPSCLTLQLFCFACSSLTILLYGALWLFGSLAF